MSAAAGGAARAATASSLPVRLPALDGVRALAVVGVIASHAGVFNLGWLGVDIFFGLSGYLITGILLDARAAHPSARAFFVPFYMRRALRILPLAWTAAVVMAWIRGEWSGLVYYVLYVVNWLGYSPPPSDLGHYWSLAVEEQFYLVWPAIVFLASPRALRVWTFGLLAADAACRLVFSVWHPAFATDQFMGLASFARADTLAMGALLAQRERSTAWGREAVWAWPVAIAAGIAIVAIRKLEVAHIAPLVTYNLKWPVIAVGVWAGLLIVLTRPPSFLTWRWLRWIGQISYGVYVIHALFGHWLHAHFTSGPVVFVLQVGITIPLAALSWYAFEAPILGLKRHWPMPSRRRS